MRWDSGSVSTPGTAMILSAKAGVLARPVDVLVRRPSQGLTYLILPYVSTVARAARSSTKDSVGEIIMWREACCGDTCSSPAMGCSCDGLFL